MIMMRNDDINILYILEIKHTKCLKKLVRFELRAIYDLNQMSKCNGIKEITSFWKLLVDSNQERGNSNQMPHDLNHV